MKYKQKDQKNQRIQQITGQTLIIGADIAKKIIKLKLLLNGDINMSENGINSSPLPFP
ncbi:hypothetical protein [Peribacillus deserti]|uniref:hypothetical protein n=1 Tax=Peribacillus deserti TaxID=673318 RepID=UPI0015E14121|nr:hypothetical protein [Peribacillus deserti]